jgi:hypothetical protein
MEARRLGRESESENRHEVEQKVMGFDEGRISRLRVRLRSEELFHALIRNPEWLESLAKTSDDLRSYQELLDQWQVAGYPNLKSSPAKGCPVPFDQAPLKAIDSTPHSSSAPLNTPLPLPVEGDHHYPDQ